MPVERPAPPLGILADAEPRARNRPALEELPASIDIRLPGFQGGVDLPPPPPIPTQAPPRRRFSFRTDSVYQLALVVMIGLVTVAIGIGIVAILSRAGVVRALLGFGR